MKIQIAKTDQNHNEIKRCLEANGYKVWSLHKAGDGVPDLLVLVPVTLSWVLLEVKMPGSGLRGKQIDFFYQTIGAPRCVVSSGSEALQILEGYKQSITNKG